MSNGLGLTCPTCRGINMSLAAIDTDLRRSARAGMRGKDVGPRIAQQKAKKAKQVADMHQHMAGHA